MLESLLADLEKHLKFSSRKGEGHFQQFWITHIPNDYEVWIKDLNPGVYLRSKITPMISNGSKEDFFMYLMKANFLGQGTAGSVITLDPDEKYLTLINVIPYEVNYRIFRDKLEDFVNYLEYWQTEIKNYEARQLS